MFDNLHAVCTSPSLHDRQALHATILSFIHDALLATAAWFPFNSLHFWALKLSLAGAAAMMCSWQQNGTTATWLASCLSSSYAAAWQKGTANKEGFMLPRKA